MAHGLTKGVMRMIQGEKLVHGLLSAFACAEQFMLNFVSDDSNKTFSQHQPTVEAPNYNPIGQQGLKPHSSFQY